MRHLRLVGVADDHTHVVVETPDGAERFALTPDPELDAALRAVEPDAERDAGAVGAAGAAGAAVAAARPVAVAPRETALGPREIQVRVRAGESPEDVAASCGVDVERIMRFAAPVLEERVRIADEARRARARRSRGEAGEGALAVFGEAVDARFAAHGIDAATVDWSARRREDGEWVVRAEWTGGQWQGGDGRHGAEWVFHRSTRSVTALDDAASDLLSDRPIRPVAPPRPALVTAPPLRPGVVAFPPLADPVAGPLPEARTEPLPAVPGYDTATYDTAIYGTASYDHPVFDQHAPEGPVPVAADEPLDFLDAELGFEEPPLPLGITDPAAHPAHRLATVRTLGRRGESEDEKAARAKIPSWDDILLGVRRKD